MTSRGAGAGLALIAAALLAVSIATPAVLPGQLALFAGHPTVHGRVFELQDVHVGLYGAELCNTGGDGACTSREPKSSFQIAALAELGLAGLLGATAVILALLTLRKSEARKGAARLVRLLALLAAAGAGVLILLGPTDEGAVPIGLGMGLYGGGVVGALLASVIAARPPPPIKLRVAERRPVAAPLPISARQAASVRQGPPARQLPSSQPFDMAAQPFDNLARFDDDPPWIGEPRSEPARSRVIDPSGQASGPGRERTTASGAGDFSGSSDALAIPLAQPSTDKPLFSSAPHLRPLYDAEPRQGGTGGLLPIERPALPSRPPTPVSRAQLNESGLPPPSPPGRSKPKTLPPPSFGARPRPPNSAPPNSAPPVSAPPVSVPPVSDPAVAVAPIAVPPTAPISMLPASPGPAARTQVSLVPPMPDNDLPIAPPTAQTAPAPPGEPAFGPEARLFPRLDTPLAAPPLPAAQPPIAQPRTHRDSQSPPLPVAQPQLHPDSQQSPPVTHPPHRDAHLPPLPFGQPPRAHRDAPSPPLPGAQPPVVPPPIAAPVAPPAPVPSAVPSPISQTIIAPPPIAPAPVRAAVPMPVRPDRPSQPVARPPLPAPRPVPPPRPTISTPVVPPPGSAPPIPAIPAIPTIPAIPVVPRRPDEVTDTEGHGSDGDPDQPTVARVPVPIEIAENTSKTHVSAAPTMDHDAAVNAAGAHHVVGDVRGSTDFDEVIDTAGRPYIARDVAFGAPDTAPTTEQIPLASEHRPGELDPHEAVTVPAPYARARGAAPITEPSPSPVFPHAPFPAPAPAPAPDRQMPGLPISTAPNSLPPPKENQRSSGPSPACPQCESPMAWVEEHLRFYCKSCRMYF